MREVQTNYNQTSQCSRFHRQASGKGNSMKPKHRFLRVPGLEEAIILPVCTYLLWTDNLHITGCTHNTRNIIEKTCKTQPQITKGKPAKTQRECVSQRKLENVRKSEIILLSAAALLQHRKNWEIFVPFAFS